jgi:hypothetical protein
MQPRCVAVILELMNFLLNPYFSCLFILFYTHSSLSNFLSNGSWM